jgi:hypothetical protein
MIKLSNRKIVEDVNTLSILAQKKLPVKAGFAIAKNLNKIEGILNAYNKERQKLIDRYCEKDEDGKAKVENNSYAIKEESKDDFNKESEELLDIENEIEIHKFKLETLDNTEISIVELQAIEYMIEE